MGEGARSSFLLPLNTRLVLLSDSGFCSAGEGLAGGGKGGGGELFRILGQDFSCWSFPCFFSGEGGRGGGGRGFSFISCVFCVLPCLWACSRRMA